MNSHDGSQRMMGGECIDLQLSLSLLHTHTHTLFLSLSEKPKWWKDEDSLSYIVNIYGAILSPNVNVNEQNFSLDQSFDWTKRRGHFCAAVKMHSLLSCCKIWFNGSFPLSLETNLKRLKEKNVLPSLWLFFNLISSRCFLVLNVMI